MFNLECDDVTTFSGSPTKCKYVSQTISLNFIWVPQELFEIKSFFRLFKNVALNSCILKRSTGFTSVKLKYYFE